MFAGRYWSHIQDFRKNILDGSLSFFGVRLFEHCQKFEVSKFQENNMFRKGFGIFLLSFRCPGVSKDKIVGFGLGDRFKDQKTIEMISFCLS